MDQIEELIQRVDLVLQQNRRIEWLLIACTALLFLVGIAAIVTALVSGHYVWSVPSAFTTFFLIWPIKRIEAIRRSNIALAVAPVLIRQLPAAEAAREIQKILEKLFRDDA